MRKRTAVKFWFDQWFACQDVRRLLALLTAGALSAAVINAFRPLPLPWVRAEPAEVYGRAEVAELMAAAVGDRPGVLIVDARSGEEYAEEHVAGAVNLPNGDHSLALDWLARHPDAERELIVYCRSQGCSDSRELADFLIQQGFPAERIRLFGPGWEGILRRTGIPRGSGARP